MGQLQSLPLWMKQVIYTEMLSDLEASISRETLNTYEKAHLLQLHVPELTADGTREAMEPSGRYPQALIEFLRLARQNYNVASICMALQWTLEQACMVLLRGIQVSLVLRPSSFKVDATLRYLGNEIRLGEYLVQIQKINWDQLDQALRTQTYIHSALGERLALGEVIINLGFIQREDAESILFLKEESKKAYHAANLSYQATTAATHALPQAPPDPAAAATASPRAACPPGPPPPPSSSASSVHAPTAAAMQPTKSPEPAQSGVMATLRLPPPPATVNQANRKARPGDSAAGHAKKKGFLPFGR